jgi:hypothetical protein
MECAKYNAPTPSQQGNTVAKTIVKKPAKEPAVKTPRPKVIIKEAHNPKLGPKSRQSSRVVRNPVITKVSEGGKKIKVSLSTGGARGSQDVIIHKGSHMTEFGTMAYTLLDSVTVPALLGAIAATGNLTLSCERLNISRLSVYAFKAENKDFARRLMEAQQLGVEAWKDEAARRAFQGWERPIYQQGLQVGAERMFSDTLALALLKAADPEHFQDRSRMEHALGGTASQGLFLGKSEEEVNEALTKKLHAVSGVARMMSYGSQVIDV